MKPAIILTAGLFTTAMLAAMSLNGCNKTGTGGEPTNQTFKLSVPNTTTTVKQGETDTAKVSVTRPDGYASNIKLEVKDPEGIKTEISDSLIKPSDKGDVQLTFHAASDAALGDRVVSVRATPEKGDPVTLDMKVAVTAK